MSKVVYLYNAKNRMHEFLGAENVGDNAVLTDGQTLVAPQSDNSYWDGQNWVSNSDLITIYHYDSNGNLDNLEIATKNATLSANETTVKPSDEKTVLACIAQSLMSPKTSGLKRLAKKKSKS